MGDGFGRQQRGCVALGGGERELLGQRRPQALPLVEQDGADIWVGGSAVTCIRGTVEA